MSFCPRQISFKIVVYFIFKKLKFKFSNFDIILTDHSVWRTVCGIHIVCCVLAAVYHLALVIEIMSGQLYNPMLHEEGR